MQQSSSSNAQTDRTGVGGALSPAFQLERLTRQLALESERTRSRQQALIAAQAQLRQKDIELNALRRLLAAATLDAGAKRDETAAEAAIVAGKLRRGRAHALQAASAARRLHEAERRALESNNALLRQRLDGGAGRDAADGAIARALDGGYRACRSALRRLHRLLRRAR